MTIEKVEGKRGTTYRVRVSRKGFKPYNKTFGKYAQAKAIEAKVIFEMDNGAYVDDKASTKLPFSEAAKKFIENEEEDRFRAAGDNEYQIKRATKHIKVHTNRLTPLSQFFGKYDAPLSQVRVSDVAEYRRKRLNECGVSENSVKRELSLISLVFKHAISEWGMENLSNPVDKVKKPSASKPRDRRLVGNEEEIILKEAAKDEREWFLPLVKWQMWVGLRIGETAEIAPEDIDLKARLLNLPNNKTDYARKVPLSQEAVDILNSFMWGKERVFWVKERTMTHTWGEFRDKLMAAGLLKENLTLHDLRHEATTRYFERRREDGTALLQIYEVRQITGHKTLDVMFNTYVNKFNPTKVVAIQGF